ncbi:MAG: HAD hydrolase-like protein [Desulfobulbus sp.]|nr:HAD hydrolase-like protein [Desulfobulbus sp.]
MANKIHPAEIGFDFDGVIADTVEAFIRIACEQYDHCGISPEDITDFTVEHCLGMKTDIAESIFLQILRDSVGTGLLPMPGSVEVLAELSNAAQVTIVTARPLAEPVHDWLQRMFSPQVYDRMQVVAMGDHDDKVRHIQQLGLSTFIDDRAETCLQIHQAGIRSIVFSQPWNRNRHQLPSVRSWEEIRHLCM